MLCKFEWRTNEWQAGLIATHAGQSLSLSDRVRKLLPMDFIQVRLVVQQINLRWPSTLKQKDHTFCLGGMMHSCQGTTKLRDMISSTRFGAEQIRQAECPHAHPEAVQKLPT